MKALVKKTLWAAATLAILSTSALAAGYDVNVTSTDLALRGVDPTSYFTEGKPVAGAFDITAEHHGATYRFASEESKQAFLAEPEKYLPQYGGYCAFGLAQGQKFDGDPQVWKIVDDKLYLNLAPKVSEIWQADIAGNIDVANSNWSTIKDASPKELASQ